MLQQTQIKTVIPYFDRFNSRFPDLTALAKAEEDEVLSFWSGLGYYSRAKNLLKTAKIIQEKGFFPQTRKELEALPGIGPYTAGAILSIAFEKPEPILDGNIERFLSRFREITRTTHYKKKLWKWSDMIIQTAVLEELSPAEINQALMEIGALICRPASPLCSQCPFFTSCKSREHQSTGRFPQKKKKQTYISLQEESHLIISRDNSFFLSREKSKWREGLWDLPDKIPENLKKKALLNSVKKINYSVTRHKVERTVYIWSVGQPLGSNNWFHISQIEENKIPYGASLKKSLQKAANYLYDKENTK